MALDTRTASLIAVGASVAANCQPCLEVNVARALTCGAHADEVTQAIDVGRRVRAGAASKLDAFAGSLNGPALVAGAPGSEPCGCRS